MFDKIYVLEESNCLFIDFNDETRVFLPPVGLKVLGLGEMIRNWLHDIEWSIELRRDFHEALFSRFRSHIDGLVIYFMDDSLDDEQRDKLIIRERFKFGEDMKTLSNFAQEAFIVSIERAKNSIPSISDEGIISQSGPMDTSTTGDSSDISITNRKHNKHSRAETKLINHIVHKIRTELKQLYGREIAKPIYAYIDQLRGESEALPSTAWQTIFWELQGFLAALEQPDETKQSDEEKQFYEEKLKQQICDKIKDIFTQQIMIHPSFKEELDKELGKKDQELARRDKKLWHIGTDIAKRLKEIIEKIALIEQALPEIQTYFQTLQERETDLRTAIKNNEKTVTDCLDELLILQANKGKLEEREINLIKDKKELEAEKQRLETTLSQLDLPISPHSEAETKSSPESASAPMQVEPPSVSPPPHPMESTSPSPSLSSHPDAFMSIKKHQLDKTEMTPSSPPTKKLKYTAE